MPDDQQKQLYTQSVTADDFSKVRDGVVLNISVPMWGYYNNQDAALAPEPPPWWTPQRDFALRSSILHEGMWAAAVAIAISKITALSWEIDSDSPLRARKIQEMLLESDGHRVGWVGFLAKQLRDFLTTDNGAFTEIVRSSAAIGSQILGLRHLDSLRCIRTGDPDIPVLFRDKWGKIHELRDHQVLMFSDMPDPSETYYGVGVCAASRSYKSIYKLAVMERFISEKVSGLRPLAIHIVNGVLSNQLKDAVAVAQAERTAQGLIAYMGAVVIGVPSEIQPQVATIPLAELPSGFNRKEEFDVALLNYADALGMDIQDLQPLSGQALGTGAQSETLDTKAKGKGLIAFRQDLTHAYNTYVLPENATFTFIEKDYRDMAARAGVAKANADVAAVRIDKGITTPTQELQILVDLDDLPKEFLPEEKTPGDKLSDTEKPEDESKVGAAAEKLAAPAADEKPANTEAADETKPTKPTAVAKKEIDDADIAKFVDEASALLDEAIQSVAFDYAKRVAKKEIAAITLKHHLGRHDQKRHGYRYGDELTVNSHYAVGNAQIAKIDNRNSSLWQPKPDEIKLYGQRFNSDAAAAERAAARRRSRLRRDKLRQAKQPEKIAHPEKIAQSGLGAGFAVVGKPVKVATPNKPSAQVTPAASAKVPKTEPTIIKVLSVNRYTSAEDHGRNKGAFVSERVKMEGDGYAIKKPSPEHGYWASAAGNASRNEAVAYLLDRQLRLGIVPPTVYRQSDDASFQQFVDGAMVAHSAYGTKVRADEMGRMGLFDILTNNIDRHDGNFMFKGGHLVAIDHGLAFYSGIDFSNVARRAMKNAENWADRQGAKTGGGYYNKMIISKVYKTRLAAFLTDKGINKFRKATTGLLDSAYVDELQMRGRELLDHWDEYFQSD